MNEDQPKEEKLKKDNQTEVVVSSNVSEKSRKHFKYRSNECLNCGQPLDLSDRYCPYCSQLNSTKPLTLSDFITEFFSSIISYDSRLRFTITDLLFKPGVISKNYIGGKRLRYTNPFRFFLSVSIIYFLMYSIINFFSPNYDAPLINFNDSSSNNTDNDESDYKNSASSKAQGEVEKKNDTINYQEAENVAATKSNTKLNETKKEDNIKPSYWIINGDTLYNNGKTYKERISKLDSLNAVTALAMKFQIFRDFYEEHEIKNENIALDSLKVEKTRFNKWLYGKNKSLDHIGDSPRDFVDYLLSKVPFFVFFFAPIYALFFWLLYMRRKFTYMEHLVFIFHIFSFVFLALVIGALPDVLFDMDLFSGLVFFLIGPIYFFLALRKFYEQSYIKTVIKFILLNIFFFISSIAAAILFFAGTAALY